MTKVGIIGTGDFAKALGHRLVSQDYSVVFGSRYPERRKLVSGSPVLTTVPILSIPECINGADFVFICISHKYHTSLNEFANQLKHKIVIDVSNATKAPEKEATLSIAENLAKILPEAHVVKAFNTLSAYSIENDISGGGKTVLVSGDSKECKTVVIEMAKSCGFGALDYGKLSSARQLEAKTHELFGAWGPALAISLVMHILWTILAMLLYLFIQDPKYTPERIPVNIMNKVFAVDAITALALCYLPGSIAAFIQLVRGTKYSRFPDWLDTWLKARKYLGILALGFALMHLCMSATIFNTAYYSGRFMSDTVIVNLTAGNHVEVVLDSRLTWVAETALLLACCATFLMASLGLTSIPAIGNYLNWRQWYFMHTYIGFSCLFLSTAHVTITLVYVWEKDPEKDIFASLMFLSCPLPWLTLFLRLLLWMPCLYRPLMKIRGGWERGRSCIRVAPKSTKVHVIV